MVNVSTFCANVGSGEGASKTLHLDVNRDDDQVVVASRFVNFMEKTQYTYIYFWKNSELDIFSVPFFVFMTFMKIVFKKEQIWEDQNTT